MSLTVQTALQDDAWANQWELIFPDGIPGGGNSTLLTLRADKQLDLPAETITQSVVEYQGTMIPKTSAKKETDKKFAVSFRIDINWEVYDALQACLQLTFDDETGIYKTEAETRFDQIVRHIGPDRAIKKVIRLYKCKLWELKNTAFDHSSGDPLAAEAQFMYALRKNEG